MMCCQCVKLWMMLSVTNDVLSMCEAVNVLIATNDVLSMLEAMYDACSRRRVGSVEGLGRLQHVMWQRDTRSRACLQRTQVWRCAMSGQ